MQYNIYLFNSTCGISNKGTFKVTRIQAMKTYERVELKVHSLLKPALDGGELSPHNSATYPHGTAPNTYGTGGWTGPSAGL
jgi:hypothetical protein